MRHELIGKTVLITGAAKRVGRSIARELYAAGANIVVLVIGKQPRQQTRLLASSTIFALDRPIALTLTCSTSKRFPSWWPRRSNTSDGLDALVNNASSFFATPVGTIDIAAWDDLVGSNLKAPLFLSQAAAPHLKVAHGAIVNITDIHAERPFAGYPLYCAARPVCWDSRARWPSNWRQKCGSMQSHPARSSGPRPILQVTLTTRRASGSLPIRSSNMRAAHMISHAPCAFCSTKRPM